MLIIELTYKKSLDEVNHFLDAHINFLDRYYAQGIFIASGPKNPRDGGIILASGDKETISKIICNDPFYQQEIADYKITQFELSKYDQLFESIIRHLD
ncbi:MAG: hypothetical protein DHS20C10_06640 [marine bacterium B5-7]|nr:MAG: hypothetical protein DHS20C10_06640 [marine bacterium B5-7]